jgi:hypothetical protein
VNGTATGAWKLIKENNSTTIRAEACEIGKQARNH